MARPEVHFEWLQVVDEVGDRPGSASARARLRWIFACFALLAAMVFARLVALEMHEGEAYRTAAARPLERSYSLPGTRGRILTRDGTVLAEDRTVATLAVHYRYLEEPPNPVWLRRQARLLLPRGERRDADKVTAAEAAVLAQRDDLQRRLARLCELSEEEWRSRTASIQRRVTDIAERVNRLRRERADVDVSAGDDELNAVPGWRGAIARWLAKWTPDDEVNVAGRVTVAEELDYHPVASGLALRVVAEVEAHPDRYPGVRVLEQPLRWYPQGTLAAHVVGHLGAVSREELDRDAAPDEAYHPDDRVGRLGLERQYEPLLRGRRGEVVVTTDHGGRVLRERRLRQPTAGRDVVLTLDVRLQRSVESLLDSALERVPRRRDDDERQPIGGAAVVLDVRTGAVLAAASAPRFDPNWFSNGADPHRLAAVLEDPDFPLFDRVSKMAIPPGSVFKTLSAIALLESGTVEAEAPFHCQGYLHHPGGQRCYRYSRYGLGHGDTTLLDALARSCNVYFFHHAGEMGPAALIDWAFRFGFHRPTGIDLPDEASGSVPTPATIRELEGHPWRIGDTQALAIGQSSLTATPLQVVRMMAAVAGGGRLVTPHLVSDWGVVELSDSPRDESSENSSPFDAIDVAPPRDIPGLSAETLRAVREGLRRVVDDREGTAHASVYLPQIPVAGKTGTAETGTTRDDHAWFAGYAPADAPRVAFVVVLEHAGGGSTMAGPVARRLVERLDELGYLRPSRRPGVAQVGGEEAVERR